MHKTLRKVITCKSAVITASMALHINNIIQYNFILTQMHGSIIQDLGRGVCLSAFSRWTRGRYGTSENRCFVFVFHLKKSNLSMFHCTRWSHPFKD